MTAPTQKGRPWLWWWRLLFAAVFLIIAASLPDDPHAFSNSFADHGVFIIAAVLMAAATFASTSYVFLRVAAMAASVLACGGRALVVVFVSSQLTTNQVVTGLAVWVGFAAAMVFLTLFADRLRQHGG